MMRQALGVCLAMLGAAQAAPYLPANGGQVLQAVPKRNDPGQQQLAVLKARLKAVPRDADTAEALARAYVMAGRREADPRFYGYAQAALSPWWQDAAPPAGIRLLRATLRQATHQFDAAITDLQALVRSDPTHVQGWLTLGTVQAVTGNYDASLASCGQLARLAPPAVMAACMSNPYAATGKAARASAMLKTQERLAANDPALAAWLAGIQGELAARQGDYAAAQAYYRKALAADPGDSYVLGAYADMLLDQRRFGEAAGLLEPHHRIDALLLRRALALRGAGDDPSSLGKAIAELDARFAAAARRGDAVHEREQARFALHLKGDASAALKLASHNWLVQKEVADARVLLESAAAANRPEAARQVVDWIARHGMQDKELERLVRQLGGKA